MTRQTAPYIGHPHEMLARIHHEEMLARAEHHRRLHGLPDRAAPAAPARALARARLVLAALRPRPRVRRAVEPC
ncbi:hypothetical protein [Georgenia ruanii]|uniref:hypothetical protein n=1 Tax=Georgenia ruanii TaxID=348442 RepID=UPI0012657D10|nr:hypothetical protein [Georgenia ruanii]